MISDLLIKEDNSQTGYRFSEIMKVRRITAIWAFSESAFGGILHALKMPFSGIFISGASVIFISMLSFYSTKKDTILKATITVILIKAFVSPHSPITAYLAVFLQGITGQLLFYSKRFFKTSALLLGVIAEMFSAVQKLLVLTVIYGFTLWKSADIFLDFIFSQFTSSDSTGIRYSFILAGLYIFMHLAAGLFFGLAAGRIPFSIIKRTEELNTGMIDINQDLFTKKKKSKRKWWKRPSGVVIFLVSFILIVLSYLTPFIGKETGEDVLFMLARSIFVMFLWYYVISPAVLKLFNKYIAKKNSNYSGDLSKIIGLFPHFKSLISYSWNKAGDKKTIKGMKTFLIDSFILLLSYEEDLSADR